ncbi:SDR family oxidoreductase [Phenylobacterium sp. LH3H17]|uniref:SDR family NAD(P)-dependent oxidoreductase n=1 Tax=Phenylobacterium sp. LH3H17 TaxID=2903901 RepID=UPI0020C9740D|nr:SDR family NAD(P)-dependent oxidoreductase [Phenylobacterium sp. LH3H17]UTP39866.1 SDR family oxidoreductase [Phenylobacterium sp. LH3H17]
MRLAGKTAIVVGAGQTPGETIGNGRAISLLFARQGAEVLCVDRLVERAEETAEMIVAEGGKAAAFGADITKAADCQAMVEAAKARWERIDILVNNVGIGGGGDGPAHRLEEAAFDRILAVNLKGTWLSTKAALPIMREQGGGAIVNISSLASIAGGNQVAYEVSKAAVNRLTTSTAQANAAKGVRCNAIAMGLMDTPMAVAGIAQASGQEQQAVRDARNARVPLGGRMGTAWDTAYAALFLASDEARFITGVVLMVDGGMSSRIG